MKLQIMILDSDVASDDVFRQSYWFRWCFQTVMMLQMIFFFSFFFFCDSNDVSDDVFRQCLVCGFCLDVEKVSVCGTNFVFQFND